MSCLWCNEFCCFLVNSVDFIVSGRALYENHLLWRLATKNLRGGLCKRKLQICLRASLFYSIFPFFSRWQLVYSVEILKTRVLCMWTLHSWSWSFPCQQKKKQSAIFGGGKEKKFQVTVNADIRFVQYCNYQPGVWIRSYFKYCLNSTFKIGGKWYDLTKSVCSVKSVICCFFRNVERDTYWTVKYWEKKRNIFSNFFFFHKVLSLNFYIWNYIVDDKISQSGKVLSLNWLK